MQAQGWSPAISAASRSGPSRRRLASGTSQPPHPACQPRAAWRQRCKYSRNQSNPPVEVDESHVLNPNDKNAYISLSRPYVPYVGGSVQKVRRIDDAYLFSACTTARGRLELPSASLMRTPWTARCLASTDSPPPRRGDIRNNSRCNRRNERAECRTFTIQKPNGGVRRRLLGQIASS